MPVSKETLDEVERVMIAAREDIQGAADYFGPPSMLFATIRELDDALARLRAERKADEQP